MRTTPVRLVLLAAVACALTWLLAVAAPAAAGTYTINACQADRFGFSTQAFGDYATRGMRWKRACNPAGRGLRGLITGNVVRSGRVARGAQSRFVMDAPVGTRFLSLNWSGKATRRDCRYSLQMYALRPDGPPVKIRNWRANRNCPKTDRTQVAQVGVPRPKRFDISGATRIVQRAVCVGGSRKRFCSARSINDVRTYYAEATVVDLSGPAVGVLQDNPFTQGAWVNATQSVTYTANDNVGIKTGVALVAGAEHGRQDRPCDYTRTIPCSNEPGRIRVDTTKIGEGTQPFQVQAIDTADNPNVSQPVTVRIDHTAPGTVPLSVEGGEGWRSQNSFAAVWQNPDEGDRAPITAAHWRLCRRGTDSCTTGSQAGTGIARLANLRVPEPGEWELRMVREDAATNRNDAYASQPVRLRYDPEPPTLGFEAAPAGDPTRVSVAVTEKISGVAGGQVEISREGSNTWQALPTRLEGSRLVARIDDAALPPGRYLLRAQATDLAGNLGLAAGAQPVTLPLRIQSTMQTGVATTKIVRKKVVRKKGRRGGKRRTVRRKVTVLRPVSRVRYGSHVTIAGRLTNRDGQPLSGQQIQVLGPSPNGDQVLAMLTTDAQGAYRYRAAGSASRTLRFVFAGTAMVLPAESQVRLVVPAAGSFKPSRKRVLNGGRVVFRGRVRSLPLPGAGKLVELQVKQPTGEWTTFRTLRTDPRGRWALRYRFRYVRCHTAYRLRARIPAEAGYPFAEGRSRSRTVTVRGAQGACP
jgi:hypothetical protein